MELAEYVRQRARRDAELRAMRDFFRKVFVAVLVFAFGFLTGAQWFARYFATHFQAEQFVRPEDQYAFILLQEYTKYWWVGAFLAIGILCFFLGMYRVTRHDDRKESLRFRPDTDSINPIDVPALEVCKSETPRGF